MYVIKRKYKTLMVVTNLRLSLQQVIRVVFLLYSTMESHRKSGRIFHPGLSIPSEKWILVYVCSGSLTDFVSGNLFKL